MSFIELLAERQEYVRQQVVPRLLLNTINTHSVTILGTFTVRIRYPVRTNPRLSADPIDIINSTGSTTITF